MLTRGSESDGLLVKSWAESFTKVPLTILHILALQYSTLVAQQPLHTELLTSSRWNRPSSQLLKIGTTMEAQHSTKGLGKCT